MVVRLSSSSSLSAIRALERADDFFSRSIERLASGQRINRASDDAAGLAIASALNKDTKVFGQAIRNINDALSYLNTADGALSQISDITTRMQELATQAANGSYSSTQRSAIDDEAYTLTLEFNRIIQSTSFNGRMVIQASDNNITFQAGYSTISFGIADALEREVGNGSFTLRASVSDFDEVADFDGDGILDHIDGADNTVHFHKGNGDGTFQEGVELSYDLAAASIDGTGDINGDGIEDIIIGYNGDQQVIYGGDFSETSNIFSRGTSAVADLDGDGKDEIIKISGGNMFLVGLNGTSIETLNSSSVDLVGSFSSIGDLDGDGDLDIAGRSSSDSSKINFYINNGDGNFSFRNSFTNTATTSVSGIEDFDGDGTAELLLYSSGSTSVYQQDATGNLQLRQTIGDGAYKIAGDINNDGLVDLYKFNGHLSTNYFLGNHDGSFVESSYTGRSGTEFVDFNNDGILDTYVADAGAAYIQESQNTTNMEYLSLGNRLDALTAIDTISSISDRLITERGIIGSSMSRLQSTLATLASSRENFAAAESRIRDADIASESAQVIRATILKQTAVAVLAQAQQEPTLALELLAE